VGEVPENLRSGLRELIIAVGTRDSARVVKAYQRLDILLPGADLKRIEQAESEVFDRFWGMSMDELRHINPKEIHDIGHRFRDLMLEMPFQVPNNLLMLIRTVAILSGMCTGLDSNFNLWQQIAPYAQKLVAQEATGNWQVWLNELGEVLKVLIALPGQSSRVLARMEEGNLAIQAPQMERRVRKVEGAINRLTGSVIFTSLLLGGVLLYNGGNVQMGNILIFLSLAVLAWTLFFVK
jgi:predicted unusual protein kinase regulating ubiquinone biosynthesis (AarF/ABC1/UbiB family)